MIVGKVVTLIKIKKSNFLKSSKIKLESMLKYVISKTILRKRILTLSK